MKFNNTGCPKNSGQTLRRDISPWEFIKNTQRTVPAQYIVYEKKYEKYCITSQPVQGKISVFDT